ncbi:hypothetical protein AGMMS49957_18470 [Synergistales bacterium]|nr:hypothetical protein AGMMS49957_18470 [Synergistales bacterium]
MLNATTAAGITEALGWAAVAHFIATIKSEETEGKKRGYDRAAKEFVPIVEKLEKDYDELAKNIQEEKHSYNKVIDDLIDQLSNFKSEKDRLLQKRNSICQTLGVSESFWGGGASFAGATGGFSGSYAWDLLMGAKINRQKAAEMAGYEEARTKIFLPKIAAMKEKLEKLKQDASQKIKEYIDLIQTILSEIEQTQAEIVALTILG